ncbi:uncharacterized protein BDZ99DRAFT_461054 [Mytilinidion resinicola]|uniref:Uncharacterized protein n=1 Tax=Mytilinidion resinicola TaxID=574789 RepID=A0A6A6YWP6_9PEZI|nr:uncharacterized protein BDZ99DRAFT_461054 [Mytilinidion resinicola]KAF2812327.1 hypothetical protein BDZ99DRAFT_461054 [Mytilinidion resinicola]
MLEKPLHPPLSSFLKRNSSSSSTWTTRRIRLHPHSLSALLAVLAIGESIASAFILTLHKIFSATRILEKPLHPPLSSSLKRNSSSSNNWRIRRFHHHPRTVYLVKLRIASRV